MVVTRSKTGHLPMKVKGMDVDEEDDEFDTNFSGVGTGSRGARRHKRLQDDKGMLPQYKVDQIEKIQRLTNMSDNAKPRCMVGEYGAFSGETKLKISQESRSKMSSMTNYNPQRDSIIKGSVTEEEKKKIVEYSKRQRLLSKVKVKDLSKDIYLKHTLSTMKLKILKLKKWNTCDIDYQSLEATGSSLALNEMGLNMLSLDKDVQQILEMNADHYREVSFKTNFKDLEPRLDMTQPLRVPNHGKMNEKITSIEEIGKYDTMFHPIDIECVKQQTELMSIIENMGDRYQNYDGDAYKGLKRDDFITVRKKFDGI